MKRVLVSAAALALGVTGAGYAQAEGGPTDKVNGGGQVLLSDQTSGPGDTVAFVAQNTADGTRGQFQYVDREDGKQVANLHGTVTCLYVEGQRAVIGGVITRGEGDTGFFQLDVFDSGRGEQGSDVVVVSQLEDEPQCDETSDDTDPLLARGNVTIHGQDDSEE